MMGLTNVVKGKVTPNKMPHGYRQGVQQPYTKWDADKDEVEVDYKAPESKYSKTWFSGRKGLVLKILILVVTFFIGLILGYVIRRSVHDKLDSQTDGGEGRNGAYNSHLSLHIRGSLRSENIEASLSKYTKKVHLTGTAENNEIRDIIDKQLKDFKIKVKQSKYQVLVSYENYTENKENCVSLIAENGTVVYQTKQTIPTDVLDAKYHPELYQYHAYSPSGTVEGNIVYANFGEEGDFKELNQNSAACKDNIVIMRYGKIFRGLKVKNAAKCGAKGVILYSDPAQVTSMAQGPDNVYPQSWWLPPWASQRGSVLDIYTRPGDPLTPGLPAKEGIFRIQEKDALLPTIPSHPIGYDDAEQLLMFMGGHSTSSQWHGALHKNVTYNMGPGYNDNRSNYTIKLEVHNINQKRDIFNVLGYIEGKEEPDRYVIVGCHYDAWTFGALDPNGGTSILTEISRAFGEMAETGWQPRRTIIFAHWDAEEQGLVGSYEYVEEHTQELQERAVAYINLDGVVRGTYTLSMQASPLLRELMMNVTKKIQIPDSKKDSDTLYNYWRKRSPDEENPGKPKIQDVSVGSDHAAFLYLTGVPVVWPRFISEYPALQGTFPGYHSAIDTFNYTKDFVDPEFKYHKTMAEMVTDAVLQLASSPKLPMDCTELAKSLQSAFDSLKAAVHPADEQKFKKLDYLEYAIGNFTTQARIFMDIYYDTGISDDLQLRRLGDRLMQVSRSFIYAPGLPGRPEYKNILYSPSSHSPSAGSTFTSIRDAFDQYAAVLPPESKLWEEVEKQISIAITSVQAATNILRDFGLNS